MVAGINITSVIKLANEGNVDAMSIIITEYVFKENELVDEDTFNKYHRVCLDAGVPVAHIIYAYKQWGMCKDESAMSGLMECPDLGNDIILMFLWYKCLGKSSHTDDQKEVVNIMYKIIANVNNINTVQEKNVFMKVSEDFIQLLQNDFWFKLLKERFKFTKDRDRILCDFCNQIASLGCDRCFDTLLCMDIIPDSTKALHESLREIPSKYYDALMKMLLKNNVYQGAGIIIAPNGKVLVSCDNSSWDPEFESWENAVYLLFVRHPDGLYLENIKYHAEELCSLYYCIKNVEEDDGIRFTDIMNNTPWRITLSYEADDIPTHHMTRLENKQRIKEEKQKKAIIEEINNANGRILARENEIKNGEFNINTYISRINSKIHALKAYVNAENLIIENEKELVVKKGCRLNRSYRWVALSKQDIKFQNGIFAGDEFCTEVMDKSCGRDFAFNIDVFEKLASEGDVFAQYYLGHYWSVESDVRDYTKAYNYYSMAAKQDDPEAMKRIGDLYADGTGVEQDYQKALEMYIKAGRWMPDALGNAALVLYELGDFHSAKKYAVRASASNDPDYILLLTRICDNIESQRVNMEQVYRIMYIAMIGGVAEMEVMKDLATEELSDMKPEAWPSVYECAELMTDHQIEISFRLLDTGPKEDNRDIKEVIEGVTIKNKELSIKTNKKHHIVSMPAKSKAFYTLILLNGDGVSNELEYGSYDKKNAASDELFRLYSYFKKKSNIYGDEDEKCRDFVEKCSMQFHEDGSPSKALVYAVSEANKTISDCIPNRDIAAQLSLKKDRYRGYYIELDRNLADIDLS